MKNLLSGWKHAPLREVCGIVSGATPKTGVTTFWGGDIAWVTPNDLSKDRSQTIGRGERQLTSAGYASCSARTFPAGSVIVSSRAPIGYVAIAGQEMCTNQGCKTAVPPDFIDSKYLYWYMLNAKADLESRASGTTFKEISGKGFGETQLAWPELAEQRRIVDILEDHLSRLDAAEHGLKLALRRLASYEAVALSLCRDGIENPLGDVTEIQGGIQKQPKRAPKQNAYPFLRVANVTKNGLDLDEVHLVELFDGELDRLRLQPGDLLVVEGNGSPSQIGRAALWDGSIADCVHQNHLIRVRPKSGLSALYLEAVWNSPQNRRQLTDLASSSSGLHTLSVSKLKSLKLPVPTLDRQRELVAEVQDIRDRRRRLDTELNLAVSRAQQLRRSLLAAAFAGRLTGHSTDIEMVEEMAGV